MTMTGEQKDLDIIANLSKKMPQRQDSAGAVCNSSMDIFFDEFNLFLRGGGAYLVLWATIHTYM